MSTSNITSDDAGMTQVSQGSNEQLLPGPELVEVYASAIHIVDHTTVNNRRTEVAKNALNRMRKRLRRCATESKEELYAQEFELAAVKLAGTIERENRMKARRIELAKTRRDVFLKRMGKSERFVASLEVVVELLLMAGVGYALSLVLYRIPGVAAHIDSIGHGHTAHYLAIACAFVSAIFGSQFRDFRARRIVQRYKDEEAEIVSEYIKNRRTAAESALAVVHGAWHRLTGEYVHHKYTVSALVLDSLDMDVVPEPDDEELED